MSLSRAVAWTLALTTMGTLALTVALDYALYAVLVVALGLTPPLFGPWPEADGFWSALLADPAYFLGPAVPWWVGCCVLAVLVLLWRRAGSSYTRETAFRQGLVASTLSLALGVASWVVLLLAAA